MTRSMMGRAIRLGPFLLFLVAGCGTGRYPVSGRVSYEDGSPLEIGTVIGETSVNGKAIGVQGAVGKDGNFSWGTDHPGDGAFPGRYKVLVMPRTPGDSELAAGIKPAVDGKFTRYETSDLIFEVKPENNVLNITVSRPKAK